MTGGTAEWRKCGLLGVEMVGGRRFCPVRSDSPHTRAEVTSALCAACPVPALVEAVRAVAILDEPDFPVGYDWMFELVHAAFAAIEEVKRG